MEHLPCENQDSCPLRDTLRGCFEDVHHLYFPKAAYITPTEKQFRQLEENKVRICRAMHDAEHAVWEIPEKPDVELMQMAITEQKNKRMAQ